MTTALAFGTKTWVTIEENALTADPVRGWSLKAFIRDGKPQTWNGLATGLTVVEHQYSHISDGYHVELEAFEGRTWLIYECAIPESVKKHVRNVLKQYGLKWDRVMDAEAMGKWVSGVYEQLGQVVMFEQRHEGVNAYRRSLAKTRFELLTKNKEYRVYKALVDELACEQLEDYYKHVIGGQN